MYTNAWNSMKPLHSQSVTVLEIKPQQVLSRCVTSGVGEFRRNAKVGFGPGREVDGNGGFMVVECEKHVQTYGG